MGMNVGEGEGWVSWRRNQVCSSGAPLSWDSVEVSLEMRCGGALFSG